MKRLILGLVLAGLIALAAPAAAPAASFTYFVGCDNTATVPQGSHECRTTDHMGAYFESSEEIEYEVCLYQNFTEKLACDSPVEATANTLYENELTIEAPGKYEVVWFNLDAEPLEDDEIGFWDLTIASPPAPPPPVVTPPVVAPPQVPVVNLACINAQKRVKKLKARVKKAHGHQKAKLRAKLRKARAAQKAAC
jgi:hypothetical protein